MSGNSPTPLGQGGFSELFADHLRRIALAKGRRNRARSIDELAASMQEANAVTPYLSRLCGTDKRGQHLSLEISLRLPVPLPEAVCRLLLPLVASDDFALPLRLNVAVRLLQSLPPDAALIVELLQKLIEDIPPTRAIERLRFFQQQLPDHTSIARFLSEYEKRSEIACPRCGTRLRRSELVSHLWQVHRLLMEGNRAREPWKLIEQWLRDYGRTGKKELLERSYELSQQLDAQNGLTRLHRLLLSSGLTDAEAQENLTAKAESRQACLCPHCYAMVPQEHCGLPKRMTVSRGRVTSHGYTIEVSDKFVFTHLLVATPEKILHEGTEPHRSLTRRGMVILQMGPMVSVALAVAILMPLKFFQPLTPVSLILLAALLIYLRIRLRVTSTHNPTHRAIDHAWQFLAPELHRPDFSKQDADFFASLAVTSIGFGSPKKREKTLERISKLTKASLSKVKLPTEDFAAVRSLEIVDAMQLGRDSIMMMANELSVTLDGNLPLAYAEQLLEAWPSETRDQGQRARLRVLVCTHAFDIGLEAHDMLELGQISPPLGQTYASEDLKGLSRLRKLWEMKPARAWNKNGSATSVFDLARYPGLGGQYLETRPDLLLFQPMSVGNEGREAGTPILICEEGIVYRDIIIKDPDTAISVRTNPAKPDKPYELIIGTRKLAFVQEPALLAKRLQGWARFLFLELLPAAREIERKRSPAKLRMFTRQKTQVCPECGNKFLALRGEVGIVTDAKAVN